MTQPLTRRDSAVAAASVPNVADMTPSERQRYVEQLGHEIANWSAELNRRLA
ncbi:MAG: hypothetical protein WAV90_00405 [Gordonia amarae]